MRLNRVRVIPGRGYACGVRGARRISSTLAGAVEVARWSVEVARRQWRSLRAVEVARST